MNIFDTYFEQISVTRYRETANLLKLHVNLSKLFSLGMHTKSVVYINQSRG